MGFCPVSVPALPKEWGPRETREKTRKGMRGVVWEAHATSRDPTLDAVGTRSWTRSCAIRRGMSKKRATAIFDLPKKWGPRNTRKDAKGDERCGLGGPCHIARPDLGPGRAPARSGVACPKNVQRQYLTCASELVTDLSGFVSDALDESEQDENQHDQNQ